MQVMHESQYQVLSFGVLGGGARADRDYRRDGHPMKNFNAAMAKMAQAFQPVPG
jgi:hypothetical protein